MCTINQYYNLNINYKLNCFNFKRICRGVLTSYQYLESVNFQLTQIKFTKTGGKGRGCSRILLCP